MNNIKKMRGLRGMTQQELSDKVNLARASIVHLESKSCRNIPKKYISALCDVLSCDIIDLYGLDIIKLELSDENKMKLAKLLQKSVKGTD